MARGQPAFQTNSSKYIRQDWKAAVGCWNWPIGFLEVEYITADISYCAVPCLFEKKITQGNMGLFLPA